MRITEVNPEAIDLIEANILGNFSEVKIHVVEANVLKTHTEVNIKVTIIKVITTKAIMVYMWHQADHPVIWMVPALGFAIPWLHTLNAPHLKCITYFWMLHHLGVP